MKLTFDQERVPLSVWPDGSVRVDCGRLHLAVVITAWNIGQSPEEIAANFPPLDLGHVYSIIGYYLHCKEEVDEYVRDWNEPWEQFAADTEAFEANEDYWQQLRIRAVEGGKLDNHPDILKNAKERIARRQESLVQRNRQA